MWSFLKGKCHLTASVPLYTNWRTAVINQHLTDSRRGKNTHLPLADLFRRSVYSRIAVYEDVNGAEPGGSTVL